MGLKFTVAAPVPSGLIVPVPLNLLLQATPAVLLVLMPVKAPDPSLVA